MLPCCFTIQSPFRANYFEIQIDETSINVDDGYLRLSNDIALKAAAVEQVTRN